MKFFLISIRKYLFLLVLLIFSINEAIAQKSIFLTDKSFPLNIGNEVEIFIDDTNQHDLSSILSEKSFKKSDKTVPVFLLPNKDIWIRFNVENVSSDSEMILGINYPNISNIWLYKKDTSNNLILINRTGNSQPFFSRLTDNVDFNFNLYLPKEKKESFYIKIQSNHPLELPITISNSKEQYKSYFLQNLIIGLYCGIIISTLLYNLFLFFATRDRSYFIYVFYLLFLGLAQFTVAGWSFKYFWPSYPRLNDFAIVWTSGLTGIFAIAFAKSFLQTSFYTHRSNKVLSFLIVCYFGTLLISLTDYSYLSYFLLNYCGLIGGLFLLYVSIKILRRGYRPAYFYLVAWSFFLLGMIVFVLRNLGIIPTNTFTSSVLYIGSSIEAILLSIALADKINLLRKEKELSQAEALKILKENEQLIKEQNVVLEKRVAERTEELETTNQELSKTLTDLKDAQTQLVEAEKMASLGQLTAGIAHEINNPINFVKSNIKPLKLDITDLYTVIHEYEKLHHTKDGHATLLKEIEELKEDLDLDYIKTEIQNLISGIEEGAERTAEIVRGLRIFSRVDEAELKTVSVHEGLDSTVVLLKNTIPPNIRIVKNYEAEGNIECYPGKLNQVFMNIINNGVQAIMTKKTVNELEYITILTKDIENNRIEISIKDSGIGMTEETKQKIFEPFFTTKDVGEGTGLGMAIVFKIIEKHSGTIQIESTPGNGAEFKITLPYVQTFAKSY